jgi:pimeloyl-ACP methyl ester carboxylesterase
MGAYAGWAGSLSREEVASRLAGFLRGFDERPIADVLEDFLPTLLTDDAPESMRTELLERMVAATRVEGTRPMLLAMAEADLRAVLPTISVPTLLLAAERDVRSPREIVDEMRRAIPGSSVVVVPRAGHQSNVEAPEAFNDAVRAFLVTVP